MSNPVKQSTKANRRSTAVSTAASMHLPAIEPSASEGAFQSLVSRLEQIPVEQLQPVNVDLQTAAAFALGVSRFVCEHPLRDRFARLAKGGEYDDSCVDELAPAAQAAWYARHRCLLEMATRSEAQVPMAMVEGAFALRARMLRLADYWLLDDAAVAAELNAIRTGTGYQDLANDLIALAALSDRYRPLLSQDRKLYQAGDSALAKQLAADIVEHLGAAATAEQNGWSSAQTRAWTHLVHTYEEVRRGGRFLLAGEDGDARFPSLIAVGRSPATRSAKEDAPAPVAGEAAPEAAPPA